MCGTQHLQVQSTFNNMFQHLEGSADNMLSTFAVVTRPAMDEPLEMAKQAGKWSQIVPIRPKIVQNRLKSLKIARFLHLRLTLPGPKINISNIYRANNSLSTRLRARSTFNIVVNISHLQRMASTSNMNSCGDLVNVFPGGYLRHPQKTSARTASTAGSSRITEYHAASAGKMRCAGHKDAMLHVHVPARVRH